MTALSQQDSHHLYLLVFKDGKKVKIGESIQVENRLQQLGIRHFDLENSYCLTGTRRAIKTFERLLHADFAEHQIPETVLSSGNTEVFDIAALKGALEEIEHRLKRYPSNYHSLQKGVVLTTAPKMPPKKKPAPARSKADPIAKGISTHDIREFIQEISTCSEIVVYQQPDNNLAAIAVTAKESPLHHHPPQFAERLSNRWKQQGLFEGGSSQEERHLVFTKNSENRLLCKLYRFIAASLQNHYPEKISTVIVADREEACAKEGFGGKRWTEEFMKGFQAAQDASLVR